MEAAVWQGEFDDVVTWLIHVRSLIWWYWPEETSFSAPVDTTIEFTVTPFELGEEDTLTYNWWLDGGVLEFDTTVSTISVDFA